MRHTSLSLIINRPYDLPVLSLDSDEFGRERFIAAGLHTERHLSVTKNPGHWLVAFSSKTHTHTEEKLEESRSTHTHTHTHIHTQNLKLCLLLYFCKGCGPTHHLRKKATTAARGGGSVPSARTRTRCAD